MNHTIQNHLSGHRLEARAGHDDEVLGFWSKALTAYQDSIIPIGSPEARFLRAYDAARLAAFAIVREAGYRSKGGEGHHYVTFDVARSLASDTDLRHALGDINDLRKIRHSVEYEARDEVDEPTVVEACRLAEQIIELGAQYLRGRRPHLVLPGRS